MISDWVGSDYSIDFANEINKLLDNFVILNPFCMIFSAKLSFECGTISKNLTKVLAKLCVFL